MQRDMELIRQIMLKVEADLDPSELAANGYTKQQILYHIWLLGDAGWMKVANVTASGDRVPQAVHVNLTSKGHDFIDAARNDTIWSRAMEKTKTVGVSLAPAVLKQLLDALIKGQLGMSLFV